MWRLRNDGEMHPRAEFRSSFASALSAILAALLIATAASCTNSADPHPHRDDAAITELQSLSYVRPNDERVQLRLICAVSRRLTDLEVDESSRIPFIVSIMDRYADSSNAKIRGLSEMLSRRILNENFSDIELSSEIDRFC